MKQFRRTAALLLTLVTLALALTVSASAKQADLTGHTYEIYQVFVGKTSKGAIKDVEWGSAIVGSHNYSSELVEALKADADCGKYFDSLTTTVAADVAEKLDGLIDEHGDAYAFAKVVYQVLKNHSVSGAAFDSSKTYEGGYYLIADTTDLTGVVGGARNMLVLQMTDKPDGQLLEIKNKTNVPELEKTVKNITHDGDNWTHSASYTAGDTVKFRLKCTLGDLLGYSRYYIKFVDQPSEAFDITTDTSKIVVYYTDKAGNHPLHEGPDEDYVWTFSNSPREFTIELPDVIKSGVTAGNIITVEYEAVFNGTAGSHANTAYVEYSCDPNNPDTTSPTPPDTTNVHNFTIIINKVDGANEPLDGAVFRLEKENGAGSYDEIDTLGEGVMIHQFRWEGLKAGKYRLVEVTAPTSDSYKPINPIEFEINPVYYDGNDTMLESLTVVPGSLFTANKDTYEITATIMNVAGATLPETGGRGTRLFYIFGSALFLTGAVLLVTKRRMYDPE